MNLEHKSLELTKTPWHGMKRDAAREMQMRSAPHPSVVRAQHPVGNSVEATLEEKVAFLRAPEAYPHRVDAAVTCRETHMSWVFLAGEKVYKLKKPVHFPYLDFSTLQRREVACRAELSVNRRLAADVYEDVVPLVRSVAGLSIGGPGQIIDWLVVMRRLDETQTLEHGLINGNLPAWKLDRLAKRLVQFYRRARIVPLSPRVHLSNWGRQLAYNRRVLLNPSLAMPAGKAAFVDHLQRRFLAERSSSIARRLRHRRIVDGHGDLRPEHIWLGDEVRIIDGLEFNAALRAVDPFDEIAFLCLECERLGASSAGEYIKRRTIHALGDDVPNELFVFYHCYRATLRARLAIAHLLEPQPRTPEKWPKLARTYLNLAAKDAVRLERLLRRPASR